MGNITKSKKAISVGGIILLCLVSAVLTYNFLTGSQIDSTSYISSNQVSLLNAYLEGNVSQVSNLTQKVLLLEDEIRDLKLVVAQQNSENQMLKEQIRKLNNVFSDVENQLEAMVKTEQIALLVERLRNPMLDSTDIP